MHPETNLGDEHSRVEATQALSDAMGARAAAALMECIPPFGWHEIATKRDLAELEERMSLRFDARIHAEANRTIRWTVGSLFASVTMIGAVAAAAVAIAG